MSGRRGHAVLRDALPRKEEHVLLIRMTPIQRTLYREFVKEFLHNYRATNPLKFFAVCCKVGTLPASASSFFLKQQIYVEAPYGPCSLVLAAL